jgi:hypothetical protein
MQSFLRSPRRAGRETPFCGLESEGDEEGTANWAARLGPSAQCMSGDCARFVRPHRSHEEDALFTERARRRLDPTPFRQEA